MLQSQPTYDDERLFAILKRSEPTRSESSAVVLDAYLRRAQIAVAGAEVEASLRDTLLTWARPDNTMASQRHFWRFCHAVRHTEEFDLDVRLLPTMEFESSSVDCRTIAPAASPGSDVLAKLARTDLDSLYVVDGQHRYTFISGNFQLDLSQRAIRQIAKRLLVELNDLSGSASTSLLSMFRHSLVCEIANRSTVKWTYVSSLPPRSMSPHTREWILAFLLRTGTPPPATLSDRRPGADAVPVAFAKASQRLQNGTLRRRNCRRNILDALRTRYRPTSYSEGAQDFASARGRTRFAGCRRIWIDVAVEERARKIWRAGGRQMASDVLLDRGRGPFRHSLRKALNGTRVYA